MQKNVDIYPHDTLLEDIPFEDYLIADGINASGLKQILRSPAHFLQQKAVPKPETPAMRMGKLAHLAVLEADRFDQSVIVRPNFNLRTIAGKADLAAWREDMDPDNIEVSEEEKAELSAMRDAARKHKILRRLLESGRSEVTLFWEDAAHNNTLCKMRADFIADNTMVIVDLKTCQDARHDAFSRDAYKHGYLMQAGHYTEGARATGVANPNQFCIVALEKTPPYGICLYSLSEDALNLGHQQRHVALERYAACVETNTWPGYPELFEDLEPPPWATGI